MNARDWISDLTSEWPDLKSRNGAVPAILGMLVERLIECLRAHQTGSFSRFFEHVEHHLIYGDADVRNYLLIHLLEQLKNVAASQNLDYAAFEEWLHPETMVAWRWLEKRWQGKGSLADQVRASKADENQHEDT
ncbi:MAG TPA: hypothetical protein VJ521_09265 [Acidobacteriota bacterium]|nr:hypothetical protein [Acidobacteriota bacterium]